MSPDNSLELSKTVSFAGIYNYKPSVSTNSAPFWNRDNTTYASQFSNKKSNNAGFYKEIATLNAKKNVKLKPNHSFTATTTYSRTYTPQCSVYAPASCKKDTKFDAIGLGPKYRPGTTYNKEYYEKKLVFRNKSCKPPIKASVTGFKFEGISAYAENYSVDFYNGRRDNCYNYCGRPTKSKFPYNTKKKNTFLQGINPTAATISLNTVYMAMPTTLNRTDGRCSTAMLEKKTDLHSENNVNCTENPNISAICPIKDDAMVNTNENLSNSSSNIYEYVDDIYNGNPADEERYNSKKNVAKIVIDAEGSLHQPVKMHTKNEVKQSIPRYVDNQDSILNSGEFDSQPSQSSCNDNHRRNTLSRGTSTHVKKQKKYNPSPMTLSRQESWSSDFIQTLQGDNLYRRKVWR